MQESELLEKLKQAVVDGASQEAEALARAAIELGVDPLTALDQGLTRGITFVGEAFSNEEMFLPDLVMAAEAMKAGSAILLEQLTRQGIKKKSAGSLVIGTAAGDLHDIGKTIVATLVMANGFEVHDLGVDVSAAGFIEAIHKYKPDLVGISCLLTTTMPTQAEVIQQLEAAGLRSQVKVLVGGGPVTRDWAKRIGADGYGADAFEAVTVAKSLLNRE